MYIRKLCGSYCIEQFNNDGNEYSGITRHNADFIESIIMIDKKYGDDLNPKITNSTAWWFDQMKNNQKPYRDCIDGIVKSIDITNSTHLAACVNGQLEIVNRICNACKGQKSLEAALNTPFKTGSGHLIEILADGIPAANKNGQMRYNISFATKFCAYAAKFLNTKVQYSKYDSIVSEVLPVYENEYLKSCRENNYNVNYKRKLVDKLKIYEEYSAAISDILASLNNNINKEEFDHIVWYTSK